MLDLVELLKIVLMKLERRLDILQRLDGTRSAGDLFSQCSRSGW